MIVTFGEVLLRLSPPNHRRFSQADTFEAYYGGAEANTAVSLCCLGEPARHVTRLPANDLGRACGGGSWPAGGWIPLAFLLRRRLTPGWDCIFARAGYPSGPPG